MSRWPRVSLGDVVHFTSGGTPSRATPLFYAGDIPWITGADLGGGRIQRVRSFITPSAVAASATSVVPAGTVLLVTRTSVGKVAIADHDVAFSQDITALRPDPLRLHTGYLTHFLRTQEATLSREARGATIQGVTREAVASLTMPIPSVEDQRRIAEMLDRADVLRAKRREALALLDNLTRSVFLDMFGWHASRSRWPFDDLQSVVRQGTLVTYGIVQAGDEVEGGVPYIRTGDLVDGEIRLEGLRHTAPEIASKFQRSTVASGDLVMSIRATVGTTAMVPDVLAGANLTQGTARVAPGDRVTPRYLLEYLRSDKVQSWIKQQIKGATFLEITLGRLRELQVLLPPKELQEAFDARMRGMDRLRAAGRMDLSRLDALFVSLQQRAFAGEL